MIIPILILRFYNRPSTLSTYLQHCVILQLMHDLQQLADHWPLPKKVLTNYASFPAGENYNFVNLNYKLQAALGYAPQKALTCLSSKINNIYNRF